MCCNCLLFWQQVICFKSLKLEQVTSNYSQRLYLCLNSYKCNLKSKYNHLFHSLNVVECTLGCQYISVTLYLLKTYSSGKPLFKGQGPVNFTPISDLFVGHTKKSFRNNWSSCYSRRVWFGTWHGLCMVTSIHSIQKKYTKQPETRKKLCQAT